MKNRVRKWGAILIATLAVAVFAVVLLMAHVQSFYGSEAVVPKDCVVVFGAAVAPGAKPTRALYDRTKSAAEIYKKGLVRCVILSGAPSVYGAHEVDVMREIMLDEGVKVNDLFFDFEGFNTQQTIENLDKKKSYILVSNDFHLARINLLAKRTGLKDFTLQASTYNKGRPQNELYWVVREMIAVIYYFFATI